MKDVSRRKFLQIAAIAATPHVVACGGASDDDAASGTSPPPDRGGSPPPAPPGSSAPPPDGGPPPPTPSPLVPGVDLDAIPARAADFPYGVMAGDATATNAMLWTHLATTGALSVQLEPIDGPKGMAVVSRAIGATETADGGFVHVDVGGLEPGKRYRYAFFTTDGAKPVARSAFGFVRAAIAPGALEVVTFAGTSCTHQVQGAPYPLLSDAAKRKFDFFLHAGDHVYCDADTDAVTLAQYRAKYAQAWGTTGMRALHASTGMLTTWDDHEFANNWNPETFPAARRNAAMQAFFEHRAVRRDPKAPNRVWRNFVWGNTLEVLVLDARSERKPSTRNDANAQFVSPEQLAWLEGRLKASTAVFKLVITSVPIGNFPLAASGEADKWEGYPAQRNALLDYIANEKIAGVFFLSGDLHFGSAGGVGPTGVRRKMIEVLMGPGGTNAGSPDLSPEQFDRAISEKNYTVFVADPTKKELTVEFIGAKGSIFKKTYSAA